MRKTGVKVKISISTIIFFAAVMLTDASPFSFMPFIAAMLHELGHIAAMKLLSVDITKITVYPFGFDITKSGSLLPYGKDLVIGLSGVAVNLVAVLFCIPHALAGSSHADFFAAANLILFIINILPIRTLDGGEVLEATLLLRLEPDAAGRIVKVLSFIFIVILWVAAVYILFYGGSNLSLFLMCVYLFSTIM